MRIFTKKTTKVITLVMASTMLLGGCASASPSPSSVQTVNDPGVKTEIDLSKVKETPYDQALMDAEYRRYCFDIFNRTVTDDGTDANIMISPASIMMALDMVAAGAKGESLKQLTELFANEQDPLKQQAYAAMLMDKINGAKDVDFSCANAVWNNSTLLGNKVNPDYVDYIKRTFLAEYIVTEFSDKTPAEINAWVDAHTDHMIDEVIDSLDPRTVMVLVNAIAFEGKWEETYDEDHVKEGDFHAADGSVVPATYLIDSPSAYFETDKATGFMKPYEGGQYAFLAILPNDGSISANEFVKGFTYEDYEAFVNSVSYEYEVSSKMPEFRSDYDCLMKNTLQNMGVKDVFSDTTADLSGISGDPGDIFVSRVIHKTHIEVDSEGTKAAAVTAVTLRYKNEIAMDTDMRFVICDRPFVYAIIDVETMTPVFIGTVNCV